MRVRWLAKRVLLWAIRTAALREPDFKISRVSGRAATEDEIYLRRWWIVPRNDWFNVYLHNMLRDDDAVLHDHPYWSLSLVLSDGLMEVYRENPPESRERLRWPRQGDLVWRSSRLAHQLVVVRPAWTLFMTGPRIREWGFWCPQGWRSWRQYVATKETVGEGSGVSGVGVGCGEQQ